MQYQILCLLCLCCISGASDSSILGGQESKPHSRQYMVSLLNGEHHHCGGVLVRKDFVLTAAHCKTKLTALLGAHNIKKKEKSQQRIKVDKYHVHPKYKDGCNDYDVMLLKLNTNAILNRNVKTIGLPKKDGKIPANIKCLVAGWGLLAPNAYGPDVLMETTVKIQFPHECEYLWGNSFNASHMICTHSSGKKGGICPGDSGGPLICNGKLQGITAFTLKDKCDDPKMPHVFMKVPYFIPWIKNVMQVRD